MVGWRAKRARDLRGLYTRAKVEEKSNSFDPWSGLREEAKERGGRKVEVGLVENGMIVVRLGRKKKIEDALF